MICYTCFTCVVCVVLTSDLSRLIHTSLLKNTWCVLQSRLLISDSFEVSVTVIFRKMTRSLSSNCPFSFSRNNFASVICCFFSVWSKIFSFRMSVLLTRSVCLFLCGFLPLFADFLSPLCLSPLFFSRPHPMKRWEAWIWLSERVGGGGSSGARRNFDLGVALGPSFASHCSCFQMKRLEMCFLIGFSLPRSVDVRIYLSA